VSIFVSMESIFSLIKTKTWSTSGCHYINIFSCYWWIFLS